MPPNPLRKQSYLTFSVLGTPIRRSRDHHRDSRGFWFGGFFCLVWGLVLFFIRLRHDAACCLRSPQGRGDLRGVKDFFSLQCEAEAECREKGWWGDGLLLVLIPGDIPLINAGGRAAVKALPTASMLQIMEPAAGFQVSPPSPELPCEGVQRSKTKSFARSSPGLQGACGASAALSEALVWPAKPEQPNLLPFPSWCCRAGKGGQLGRAFLEQLLRGKPYTVAERWCLRLPLGQAELVLPANHRGWFKGHISNPNKQDADLPPRVVVFKVHRAATRQLKAQGLLFSFILTR